MRRAICLLSAAAMALQASGAAAIPSQTWEGLGEG
jgi:hypothetical protein